MVTTAARRSCRRRTASSKSDVRVRRACAGHPPPRRYPARRGPQTTSSVPMRGRTGHRPGHWQDIGMTQQVFARIAGTGSYLPEKVLTNADLAKTVDTSDEWIATRTGIRERHIAADGETTGDLAYHAAVRALEAAGVAPSELDLIILGTTTPDLIFPSTACLLQHRLGANGCPAFDVNAACCGFVYALTIADKFIRSGAARTVLVIGAETLTR